jgi:hypothetical protein
MRYLGLFLTAGTALLRCSFASAQQVDPGYDLFTTINDDFVGNPFSSNPLGSFTFPNPDGNPNPITFPTGDTDTIIQRLSAATPGSPTVAIQMDAFQLVSTTPISFDGGPVGFYFITLQSTDGTGPASTGQETIYWNANTGGTFTSSLDVYFDVHYSSANGPIVDSGNRQLTSTDVDWSSVPAPGDLTIPSINFILDQLNGNDDLFLGETDPVLSFDVNILDGPAMPEPASLGLLAVGAFALWTRPRRKRT